MQTIVCDFDRTLTDESLIPSREAFEAIKKAKVLGLRFIIVSGRPLDFLLSIEEILQTATAVVAENGAIAFELSTRKKSSPFVDESRVIKEAFQRSGLKFQQSEVMTSLSRRHEKEVRAIIARDKLDAEIHFNIDSIMILPTGVSKGSGLLLVLNLIGVPKLGIICFGDGENDMPLFEEADISVAVANALTEVKAKADIVTSLPGGRGVAELVNKMLPNFGRL